MKVYMIIADRDLVYPECIFVTKDKDKAEQKFKELAGMDEINEIDKVKYVHKSEGYATYTYTLIAKELDKEYK